MFVTKFLHLGFEGTLFIQQCGSKTTNILFASRFSVKNQFYSFWLFFLWSNWLIATCNFWNNSFSKIRPSFCWFILRWTQVQPKIYWSHIIFLSKNLYVVGCAPKVRSCYLMSFILENLITVKTLLHHKKNNKSLPKK